MPRNSQNGYTQKEIATVFIDIVAEHTEAAKRMGYGIIGLKYITAEINAQMGLNLTKDQVSRFSTYAVKLSGTLHRGYRMLGNPVDGYHIVDYLNENDIKNNVLRPCRTVETVLGRMSDSLDVRKATPDQVVTRGEVDALNELAHDLEERIEGGLDAEGYFG
jgi:hypothetical protein